MPVVRPLTEAFVGLGANLGNAQEALAEAVQALAASPGIVVDAVSSLYRSAPVDADGPDYLNAVACLHVDCTAPALLNILQALELHAGRTRPYPNAPRTLDLDLLLYGDGRIGSARLTVPHPRMAMRAFVLVPLAEIAPGRVSAAALDAVRGQRLVRVSHFPFAGG